LKQKSPEWQTPSPQQSVCPVGQTVAGQVVVVPLHVSVVVVAEQGVVVHVSTAPDGQSTSHIVTSWSTWLTPTTSLSPQPALPTIASAATTT